MSVCIVRHKDRSLGSFETSSVPTTGTILRIASDQYMVARVARVLISKSFRSAGDNLIDLPSHNETEIWLEVERVELQS